MTLETDLLLDRRQLKRRLFLWRSAAFLAVLLALLVMGQGHVPGLASDHVARLTIAGVIHDDRPLVDAVDQAARNPAVKAMIVSIDSPGGSVAGGEDLHDAIARVAARKPVVAVMRGTAASAGYMVALPAARIFARPATLTGSIGVLLEAPEFSGLMDKLGIGATTLVSGPLKDQPSLTHPLSPAGKVALQGIVDDMYNLFVEMVAQARHMEPARVRALADGRAYTGRQAKALGLIDDFGGEPEARDWLQAQDHVATALPIRDIRPGRWTDRHWGAHMLGTLAMAAIQALSEPQARFDGALALWQAGISTR